MTRRVLVLYNAPTLEASHPLAESEHEVLETVAAVRAALQSAGFDVESLGLSHDPSLLVETLKSRRPEVVFNLFEGLALHGATEAHAAGILDWLGVKYTGCPFASLVLARDKPRAKLLLQGAGLPTPAFESVERLPLPVCRLRWPVIVKPGMEDASVGLDQQSVVTSVEELNARASLMLARHGSPVLLEEYIEGREFNVAVVERNGVIPLPVSEIVFSTSPDMPWSIVTYDSKWKPGSAADLAAQPRCPASVDSAVQNRLQELAVAAFRLFGCRQYIRVDFRVTPRGDPYILEINTNPDFHPEAGLARSLRAACYSHAEFTVHLVESLLGK